MKKEFSQIIEIPEGVEVSLDGTKINAKGSEGENSREFKLGKIKLEIKDKQIILRDKNATKKEKKKINTTASHIRNMIKGVQKKFEYQLKVCSSHFPISVEKKDNEISVKNFLGEKTPRKCSIPQGAEVEISKDIITIKSSNKEIAGQAAANFEAVTKVKNRDRRVFQDGIYIINKDGKEI